METQKTRLTPEDCMAFAQDCEADAQAEQDSDHRARLLRMAGAMRGLADDLRLLHRRQK